MYNSTLLLSFLDFSDSLLYLGLIGPKPLTFILLFLIPFITKKFFITSDLSFDNFKFDLKSPLLSVCPSIVI